MNRILTAALWLGARITRIGVRIQVAVQLAAATRGAAGPEVYGAWEWDEPPTPQAQRLAVLAAWTSANPPSIDCAFRRIADAEEDIAFRAIRVGAILTATKNDIRDQLRAIADGEAAIQRRRP
jgi:hypothetical protein